MTKLLPINKCWDCTHVKLQPNAKEYCDITLRPIDEYGNIPSNCPLQDAKNAVQRRNADV